MSELTHFGVPGMKWGHRKAQAVAVSNGRPGKPEQVSRESRAIAKRAESVKRGDALIAKYGSVNKAYLAVGVRRVAVAMANVGANNVAANMTRSKIEKNGELSKMGIGINIVANSANMGMFVKDVIDARNIHRASVARGN